MLTDVITLTSRNYVTVAVNDVATVQNVSMSLVKPPLETMLTVNSVQLPKGMEYSGGGVTEGDSSLLEPPHYIRGKSRAQQDPAITYTSFLPQKSNEVYFFISANDSTNNKFWSYSNRFSMADVIDITPWFTDPLSMAAGQSGRLISWDLPVLNNQSAVPVELQQHIDISPGLNSSEYFSWLIVINGSRNSLTLPELPIGVSPLLNIGTEYHISNTVIAYHGYSSVSNIDQYHNEYISSSIFWTR